MCPPPDATIILTPAAVRTRRVGATYTPHAQAPTRLPSLDGLRAVSLGIVLLNHAASTHLFPAALASLVRHPLLGLPELGLRTFFIISGFLITSLLLKEFERDGTVDWGRFVLRRSARIFPAYFSFVAIVGCLASLGVLAVNRSSLIDALTFTVYMSPGHAWDVGHLWSMGMQEQFYLLWPLVFLLFGKRGAGWAAWGVASVFCLGRLVVATVAPDDFSVFNYRVSFDTLAVGCLYALYRERLSMMPLFNRLVESRIWIPLIFLGGNLVGLLGYRPHLLLRLPIISVAILLLIERCVRHPHGIVGRLLNHRIAVYIGSASFSMYLWQQLFLDRSSTSIVALFPLNLLIALAVGALSWHLIEQPAARALRKVFPRQLGARAAVRLTATISQRTPTTA